MEQDPNLHNPMKGIMLKVLSVLLFVAMSALVKSASDQIPPGEIVFFRSAFAFPVVLVWLLMRHDMKGGLKTQNPVGHFWRGLVGTTSMAMGFVALSLLPLPEVTAIGYAAPVLTVILAAMFLGEQVRLLRMTAVIIGLFGVVIILSPRLTLLSIDSADKMQTIGAVMAFMGAVFMALAQVFVRKLVGTERPSAIVFYFTLTATFLSLLTIPFGWVMPDGKTLLVLVAIGLIGGVGQIFLTNSYRHADTAVIAPFEYASLLFALAIGFVFFGEVPTLTVLAGASVVVCAGLLIIWREAQLGIERRRQRRAMTPH